MYKGNHPPIISKDLFDTVQEVMNNRSTPKVKKERFAFRGLMTCGHCGCGITAQIQKGRYVYYRCTGFKGKCGQRWVREEELDRQYAEIVKKIKIDEEVVEWVKNALKTSHKDEKQYHEGSIRTLTRRYEEIQRKIDKMYEDKLEGLIDDDLWTRKFESWKEEQGDILRNIEQHKEANRSYFEEGVQILKLANKAYSLYVRQNLWEKRKLLDILLYNCSMIDGTLCPTYRKPFDMLAKGLEIENWRGRPDLNRRSLA
ncbi:MAG: zinc ribbon domain-containing protein [Gemmatimonadota bacterium]|nr:MAG: zinc ribbon domain-containing protein [Gemmatimonadota bacterium]